MNLSHKDMSKKKFGAHTATNEKGGPRPMSHILRIAEAIHNHYENQSKKTGWKTQKKCQVVFNDLPQENKEVMIDIAQMIVGSIILASQELEIGFLGKINHEWFIEKFTSFLEENTKEQEQEK
ncbi:MAG: hypothetical protein GPJ52_01960 [Candidatus Heimdallarchaeota archaeon]|nr:hypothetical protein [Candidatus Heimdallarchaeota archaeon]